MNSAILADTGGPCSDKDCKKPGPGCRFNNDPGFEACVVSHRRRHIQPPARTRPPATGVLTAAGVVRCSRRPRPATSDGGVDGHGRCALSGAGARRPRSDGARLSASLTSRSAPKPAPRRAPAAAPHPGRRRASQVATRKSLVAATAATACIATFLMGAIANVPFAIMPGARPARRRKCILHKHTAARVAHGARAPCAAMRRARPPRVPGR